MFPPVPKLASIHFGYTSGSSICFPFRISASFTIHTVAVVVAMRFSFFSLFCRFQLSKIESIRMSRRKYHGQHTFTRRKNRQQLNSLFLFCQFAFVSFSRGMLCVAKFLAVASSESVDVECRSNRNWKSWFRACCTPVDFGAQLMRANNFARITSTVNNWRYNRFSCTASCWREEVTGRCRTMLT